MNLTPFLTPFEQIEVDEKLSLTPFLRRTQTSVSEPVTVYVSVRDRSRIR